MKYHISFDLELLENTYKGKYIALEGIDGSGKSTQLHLVARALRSEFSTSQVPDGNLARSNKNSSSSEPKANREVILTSEPLPDSVVGKIIREVLQSRIKMPSSAFQYLYSADRVINQETIVKPALEKGDCVLTHRSFWSVIPYGLMDRGLTNVDVKNAEVLMVAHGLLSQYHQFICPDITLYLDVPVDIAMKRLSEMDKTKDLYEKKEKLEQIQKGYEWEMQKFPDKFVRIDGTQSEEQITDEIVKKVLSI